MSALQLVTKQCRPLCRFLGLKLHCLAPSSKIFRQHICQAKGLDTRIDKYKCTPFRFCLSRSYFTHTSLTTLSTMDKLNIQEIESSECKKIILHLMVSFFNLEEKDLLNQDTLMILFEKYKEWGECNGMSNLKHYQKLVSDSNSFQKFLEMLPFHLDSMRLDELVDVFGGLLLLGIPETNSVITEIMYKFVYIGLGARELAKLSAIFDGGHFNFNSRHIVQYTLLAPALKSLLVDYSLDDRNDLVYLSNLMSPSWIETYPEVMDTYTDIISDALGNVRQEHANVDCLLAILNGVCECIRRGMVLSQPFNLRLMELFIKVLDMLKPDMPNLTPEQSYRAFSSISSIYSTKARELITQSHRSIFDDFEKMHSENFGVNKQIFVLRPPDSPWIKKCTRFNYFKRPMSRHGLLMKIIPHADELTLLDIVQKDTYINGNADEKGTLGLIMKNRLLELLDEKFSNAELIEFQKQPYYPYLEIMEILQTRKKNDRGHLAILWGCQTYLKSWLRSGYACDNGTFRRICHVAIGLMGFSLTVSGVRRIENIILSMDMSQLEYVDSFLGGVSSRYAYTGIFRTKSNQSRLLQKKMGQTLENAFIRRMRDMKNGGVELLDVSLEAFGGNLQNFVRFRRCLGKALQKLENAEEYFLSSLDRNENHRYLTEDIANRILKLYAQHFNTKFAAYQPSQVLVLLLQSFYQLSRLPQHLEELKQLATHVLDTEFNGDCGNNIVRYYQLLYLLCNMEIYFDEHIQRAFIEENIKEFIRAVTTGSKVKEMWNIGCLILLNRHICIHRPELGIPWKKDLYLDMKKTSTGDFRMDLELGLARQELPVLNDEFLEKFFNGTKYYTYTDKYYNKIKYQYFLDSKNKPVTLSLRDEYLTYFESFKELGYKSCVIEHSNWTCFDCLTNDENAFSLHDARRVLDLEALGNEVIFIPAHEWLGLLNDSEKEFVRYNAYEYLREKCKITLTL